MKLFTKLIACPIVLIIISCFLLGINFYNRTDRVGDIKDAVLQSVGTESTQSNEGAEKSESGENSQRSENSEDEKSAKSAKSAEEEDEALREIKDKININTATASELQSLDGIGKKLSQRIVEKREELGGFSSIDQLLYVDGIGNKIFDGIKDYVTVY